MVAVRPGDVDAALARPDPRAIVLLIYGPDPGLVSERARTAAAAATGTEADPFQLARIDGDVVASDPGRLADEAFTLGLFGGRRTIWVSPTGRNIAPAVEAVLSGPACDARVIIEAGNLTKASPLRVVCERSPKALALPSYADTARDIATVISTMLDEAGIGIDPDARTTLAASLGENRLASRAELAKLLLYAHGRPTITLEDIEAVVSDVSGLAIDAVIDAAFSGEVAPVEAGLQRLLAEGTTPATILGGVLRHALTLLERRASLESGRPANAVVESWRGLHFKRKPTVEAQLLAWTSEALRSGVAGLQAALLTSRRQADLGLVVTSSTLLTIARQARLLRRRRST